MLLPFETTPSEGSRTLNQSLAQTLSDLFRRNPAPDAYLSGPTTLDQIPDLAQEVLATARQA